MDHHGLGKRFGARVDIPSSDALRHDLFMEFTTVSFQRIVASLVDRTVARWASQQSEYIFPEWDASFHLPARKESGSFVSGILRRIEADLPKCGWPSGSSHPPVLKMEAVFPPGVIHVLHMKKSKVIIHRINLVSRSAAVAFDSLYLIPSMEDVIATN
jgi:hypothetical protein